ncbi:TPA: type-F conjugative transfer system pilin chaperone TraQ [Enterobacter roggenkampii]
MNKRKFRLPELDVAGLWVFSIGIWFHILARLAHRHPAMTVIIGELGALCLVLWGGYRMLDAMLQRVSEEERAELQSRQDKLEGGHDEVA